MKRFVVPALLFIFTVLNISCTSIPPVPPTQNHKQNVIELAKASTVALLEKDDEAGYFPFCTGVWINQSTILTAAHCANGYAQDQYLETLPPRERMMAELLGITYNVDPVGMWIPYAIEQDVPELAQQPKHTYLVQIHAIDSEHDLAILTIGTAKAPEHKWLKVKDTMPKVGDDVWVVGHPQMLYYTVMPGTISGIRMTFPTDPEDDFNANGPLIQVYSGIFHGNSGGPIVSDSGEIVGITSFMMRAPNQGFAVACPAIKDFIMRTYFVDNQPN